MQQSLLRMAENRVMAEFKVEQLEKELKTKNSEISKAYEHCSEPIWRNKWKWFEFLRA